MTNAFKRTFLSLCGSAGLLLFLPFNAQADVTEQQWAELNKNLVDQHVVPRYQQLAQQAQALSNATTALCAANNADNLKAAQSAYIKTMDAWQAIQHVRFGPIEFLMRSYSLQFWPDKKNLTSKQLNQVLAEQDPAKLSLDYLNEASIAIKGLPAMERILFSPSVTKDIADSSYRCDYLNAVGEYVALTSKNTSSLWDSYRVEMSQVSEEGLYYTHQEASVDLMKALVEPIEIIRDLKLTRPLGEAKARPRRLESWRSGQSLENMLTNVESLQHMYDGVEGLSVKQLLIQEGAKDRVAAIDENFASIEKTLASLPKPLASHLKDPSVRPQLTQVISDLSDLHENLGKSMLTLSLQLGFNSRDGD